MINQISETAIANELAKANRSFDKNDYPESARKNMREGWVASAFDITFEDAAQIIDAHMSALAEIEQDMAVMLEEQADYFAAVQMGYSFS